MASAVELFNSRVGDVSADRAGFTASRTFLVTIDTVGENADDVLRNKDSNNTGLVVPMGEPHPTRLGLNAAFYTVEARLTHLKHRVKVVYAPPQTLVTEEVQWEYSYNSGLASSPANRDLSGTTIGPATYKILKDGEAPAGAVYRVTLPGDEPTDEVPEPPGPRVLRLVESGSDPAFIAPAERQDPVGSFSLSRVFTGMSLDVLSAVAMLGGAINFESYVGFPERTLQFIGPTVQAGQGVNPETGISGFVWRVTLNYEWDSRGFTWEAQDTYRSSRGEVPVVYDNEGGAPVIREWNLYPVMDFVAIEAIILQFAALSGPTGGN